MVDQNPPKTPSKPSTAQNTGQNLNGTSSSPSVPTQQASSSSVPQIAPPQPQTQTPTDQQPSSVKKKEDKKAEKAARRAKAKDAGGAAKPLGSADAGQSGSGKQDGDACKAAPQPASQRHDKQEGQGKDEERQQQLPSRQRRQSQSRPHPHPSSQTQSAPAAAKPQTQPPADRQQQQKREKDKQIPFLSHLYHQNPRRGTLEGASKEVHPAIQMLALQISAYVICGSHARCAATLLALKAFIQSYSTPPSTSLPRHLSSTALSPQLTHLKLHSRPFSTTQSSAIRWLKNAIATLDPSLPDANAKSHLSREIDRFIRERLTVADEVIASAAASHIRDPETDGRDGSMSTVLVFGKSAVVTRALATAAHEGERFHVLVADARPLHEGKALARSLATLNPSGRVSVSLCSLAGLATAAQGWCGPRPTLCLLGAHTVLSNGFVQARAGTAAVAMTAREELRVPVYFCAEGLKFSERAALDGIAVNELAPEGELGLGLGAGESEAAAARNINIANLMYDVTPPEHISGVITELGSVPATSAAVVQRIVGEKEERSVASGGGVGAV